MHKPLKNHSGCTKHTKGQQYKKVKCKNFKTKCRLGKLRTRRVPICKVRACLPGIKMYSLLTTVKDNCVPPFTCRDHFNNTRYHLTYCTGNDFRGFSAKTSGTHEFREISSGPHFQKGCQPLIKLKRKRKVCREKVLLSKIIEKKIYQYFIGYAVQTTWRKLMLFCASFYINVNLIIKSS